MTAVSTPPLKASRYLEFSHGGSNKFWKIELDGSSHTVTFGRIGTKGQTQTKDFGSNEAARKAYDKLVAEKSKKGYADAAKPKSSTVSIKKKTAGSSLSNVKESRTKSSPKGATTKGATTPIERMQAAIQTVQTMDVFPEFLGPVPEKTIKAVEKKLGLPIEGSYREFVSHLGDQSDFGFCGVNSEYPEAGTAWLTTAFRRTVGLPKHFLVVWCDEGQDEACIMDCSHREPDGEFLTYWVHPETWQDRVTENGIPFVEFFEKYFDLEPGGRPVVKKKSPAEIKEQKRQAQAEAETRKLVTSTKSVRGGDKPVPLMRRMEAAILALLDSGYSTPISGPVPDKVIDGIAKKLGVPITGSYRRFIQLIGNQKGGMRGIDRSDPAADLLHVTKLMRHEYGLAGHYLVVYYDENADDFMQQVFLLDCSKRRDDGELPAFEAYADDWKGTLTRRAPSFVDLFIDYYADIKRQGDDAVVSELSREGASAAKQQQSKNKNSAVRKKEMTTKQTKPRKSKVIKGNRKKN